MTLFLNNPIDILLSALPFCNWKYYFEDNSCDGCEYMDDDKLSCIFIEKGLQISCRKVDKHIKTIFLMIEDFTQNIDEFPYPKNKFDVNSKYGNPTKTKNAFEDKILGRYGGFDSYEYENHAIHFEYHLDEHSMKMITFIAL